MKWPTTLVCFWLAFAAQVSQVKILNAYETNSVSSDNLMTNSTKRMTFPVPDEDDQDDSSQISNLLEVDPTDEEIDNIFDGISSPKNTDSDVQNSYKYKLPLTAFTKTIKDNRNNDIDDDLDDKSTENNDRDSSSDNLLPRESINDGLYNQHYDPVKFRNSKSNEEETNDQIRNYFSNDENHRDINIHRDKGFNLLDSLEEKERYYINKDKKTPEEEEGEEKESPPNRYNYFSQRTESNFHKNHPLDEEYVPYHNEHNSPDNSAERSNTIYNKRKLFLMHLANNQLQPEHTSRSNNFDIANNELYNKLRDQETHKNPNGHIFFHLKDNSLFSDNSKNDVNYHQSKERLNANHHINFQDKLNNPLLFNEKLSNQNNNLGSFDESQNSNDNNKLYNPQENIFDKSNNDNSKFNNIELSQGISRLINLIKAEYSTMNVEKEPENENQNLFNHDYMKETDELKKENFHNEYLSQLYRLLERFRSDYNHNLNKNKENSNMLLRKIPNELLSSERIQQENSRFKEGTNQLDNVYKQPFFKSNNVEGLQRIYNYGKAYNKINLDRFDASNNILTKEINRVANNIALLQMSNNKPIDSFNSDFTNNIKSHSSYENSREYNLRNEPNGFSSYDGQSDHIQPFKELNKYPYHFSHKYEQLIKKNPEFLEDSLLQGKTLNRRPLDMYKNEISNKKTEMNSYMPMASMKDDIKENNELLRNYDQSRKNNADTISFFKTRDGPSSFGESFNTNNHLGKIPSRNIIISGPAIRKFNKNQEENDLLIRKDLDALNEKETKVAAYEALKDDEFLKIAQKIADDSPSDRTGAKNS